MSKLTTNVTPDSCLQIFVATSIVSFMYWLWVTGKLCLYYLKISFICTVSWELRDMSWLTSKLLFQARNSEQLSSWKLGLGLLGLSKVICILCKTSWTSYCVLVLVLILKFRWPIPRQSISMVLCTGTIHFPSKVYQTKQKWSKWNWSGNQAASKWN